MKKIIFVLLVLCPLALSAQPPELDDVFRKFTGVKGYKVVEITSGMLKMMQSGKSGGKANEAFNSLEKIRVLNTAEDPSELFRELERVTGRDGNYRYDLISSIADGEEMVKIFVKKKHPAKKTGRKDLTGEMLVITSSDGEITCIQIVGDLDISKITPEGMSDGAILKDLF